MIYFVKYGKRQIEFNLKHVARKTLQINVYPDLSIEVKAPLECDLNKIFDKVRKRGNWIVKQQNFFKQFLPLQPPRRFISGETHRYLGRQYRLKVIESQETEVKMTGGYIKVFIKDTKDFTQVKKLVDKWYRIRAEKIFSSLMQELNPIMNKLNISTPLFKIRYMKTRWGSCSRNGNITLNSELIKAPKSCIKYVIIHELCHLKEYQHTRRFYALLEDCMPLWKKEKKHLDKMADLIL